MSRILERYLDFVALTEPRENFHRWSFISGCSAILSRNIYFPFGHMTIYPNMYVFIVGGPGTRKSTAIKIVKGIAGQSGFTEFAFDKTSKQKFLMDFSHGFNANVADGVATAADLLDQPFDFTGVSNAYVCNDEIVDFLGVNNFEMASLLAKLWDNLPEYSERLKNSDSVKILKPTVNVLGGITPVSIQLALPSEAMGQGFMSRIVLVYADSIKRKITFPKAPSSKEQEFFIKFFQDLKALNGEMSISEPEEVLLDKIYNEWRNTLDVRLESYAARRFIHLLKLCQVIAAMDLTTKISTDHIIEANTILLYTEKDMASALGEYGQAKNTEAQNKIITALSQAADNTLEWKDLWKQVQRDLNDIRDLNQLINSLRQAGRVHIHDSSQVTLIKEVPLNVEGLADFNKYIREYTVHVEKT